MVEIGADLTGDLTAALDQFEGKVKREVLLSGAAAMARVMYAEVKLNASPPRMGRKSGNLESSIYRVYSPERSKDGVQVYLVSWNKSKAPHGHLLENGTSRMPAKPFVRPAFESKARESIDAGLDRIKGKMQEIGS